MIVISDTSCVTNLLAIGEERLLERLFTEVVIPEAVGHELRREHAQLPGFIRVVAIRDVGAAQHLASNLLAEGEAEAIVLAEELAADFLLMDETAGRAVATQRGLRVIGLLGVLRRAKDRGLIAAIRPLLAALQNDAGFWVSPELRQRVLEDAGES